MPVFEGQKVNDGAVFAGDIVRRNEAAPSTFDALKQRLAGYEQYARSAPDPATRALRTGASGARQFGDIVTTGVGALIDPSIKDPILGALGATGEFLYNLPTGTGQGRGVGESLGNIYGAIKQAAPTSVQNLEDALALGAVTMPSTRIGSGVERLGKAVTKSGELGQVAKKRASIQRMVSNPIDVEDITRGRVKDILLGRKVTPSEFQGRMIDEVSKVKGVSGAKSIVNNAALVAKEAQKKAESLMDTLKTSKVKFSEKGILKGLDNVVEDLKQNPFLVTEKADGSVGLKASARTIVEQYKKILEDHPKTPAGLLKTRREFDKLMESFSGKVFDPTSENVRSIVTRELRSKTNDLIARYIEDVDVKKSLSEQHLLFSAAENMALKGKKTAQTGLGRLSQSALSRIPLKGEIAGLAALGGLGYTGALSPAMGAGLMTAYGGYKGLTHPMTRRVGGYPVRFLGSQLRELERVRAPQAALVNGKEE